MKHLLILALLWSAPVFACWQLQGVLRVDQHKVKVNQKVSHDKSYSFQSEDYIFNLKIPSTPSLPPHLSKEDKWNEVEFEVLKRVKTKLEAISKGNLIVQEKEEGIFSLHDPKTNTKTTITVKLTHI
jgi:hypothetical protein